MVDWCGLARRSRLYSSFKRVSRDWSMSHSELLFSIWRRSPSFVKNLSDSNASVRVTIGFRLLDIVCGCRRCITSEKIKFVKCTFFPIKIVQIVQTSVVIARISVIGFDHQTSTIQFIVTRRNEFTRHFQNHRWSKYLDSSASWSSLRKTSEARTDLLNSLLALLTILGIVLEETRLWSCTSSRRVYLFDSFAGLVSPLWLGEPPFTLGSLLMPSNFFTAVERMSMIVST